MIEAYWKIESKKLLFKKNGKKANMVKRENCVKGIIREFGRIFFCASNVRNFRQFCRHAQNVYGGCN
jgi:hypothetical protein